MERNGPGRIKLTFGLLLALILMVAGFVLITKNAGATPARGGAAAARPAATVR